MSSLLKSLGEKTRYLTLPGEELLFKSQQCRWMPGGKEVTPSQIIVSNQRIIIETSTMLGLRKNYRLTWRFSNNLKSGIWTNNGYVLFHRYDKPAYDVKVFIIKSFDSNHLILSDQNGGIIKLVRSPYDQLPLPHAPPNIPPLTENIMEFSSLLFLFHRIR